MSEGTAAAIGSDDGAGAREVDRQPLFQVVGDTLSELGVDTCFGLIGSGNFKLAEYLSARRGAAWHWARHETASVTMADAWARVTGRTGVVTVHQGPGLTNALTGLTEAVKARTPLLLLAAEVATTARGVTQQLDQDAVAGSVGAGSDRIRSAATAVEDTARALRRTQVEQRPIVLSLPIDIQEQLCPSRSPSGADASRAAAARPSEVAVGRVADLIEAARRPLIIAGRGAVRAGAGDALEELAERIGALLATSAPAKGLFARNPFSLGISGGFASPVAARLIPRADVVLAFGASLNRWTTRHEELIDASATVMQCDVDESRIALYRRVNEGLIGDARQAAAALTEEVVRRGVEPAGFRGELDARDLEGGGWDFEDRSTADTIDPRTLMLGLERRLPVERMLTTDAGHFQGYPPMLLSVPDPSGFVFTQAFQSVGLGLASGVGAAIARPDRLTVTVLGDGGTMMSLGELDTAVSHRLKLLVVVMDDGAYGAEVHHFDQLGLPTDIVVFGQRDFAAIARAMGARSAVVRATGDLDQGLDEWLRAPDGPMLLDCKVNPAVRAKWLEEAFRGGA